VKVNSLPCTKVKRGWERLGYLRFKVQQEKEGFLFSTASRLALEPTYPLSTTSKGAGVCI
jgi:hypothetical protein